MVAAVDVRVLAGLFVLCVAVGGLARVWGTLPSIGRAATAVAAALASVVANNLPAAMLFTAAPPVHPRALLLGLRVARSLGARPSVARYSSLGVVVVPVSLGAALGALWLLAPWRL